ncbi:MAG: SigE family RNA polymerase sigma factor [Mycobacteriales bacterium]
MDVQDSFEQYVRERGPALARTGAFLLGDVHLGEDLAQEVLAALSLRWDRVRRADDVEAYVHRAMTNTATSRRRRRSWHERPGAAVPETAAAEAPRPDEALLSALRRLPPRQRAVVVLRYYADRTEAQTAHALGCSVGTVKSQHAKAVATLRTLLPTPDLA